VKPVTRTIEHDGLVTFIAIKKLYGWPIYWLCLAVIAFRQWRESTDYWQRA
jgi:hypothetical protein